MNCILRVFSAVTSSHLYCTICGTRAVAFKFEIFLCFPMFYCWCWLCCVWFNGSHSSKCWDWNWPSKIITFFTSTQNSTMLLRSTQPNHQHYPLTQPSHEFLLIIKTLKPSRERIYSVLLINNHQCLTDKKFCRQSATSDIIFINLINLIPVGVLQFT